MIKGVGGLTNYADSEDGMDLTVGFVSVGYPMGAHFSALVWASLTQIGRAFQPT